MSITEARKLVEDLELDNRDKWGFFNYLMELCANPEFLGSRLIFVYAMLVSCNINYAECDDPGENAQRQKG